MGIAEILAARKAAQAAASQAASAPEPAKAAETPVQEAAKEIADKAVKIPANLAVLGITSASQKTVETVVEKPVTVAPAKETFAEMVARKKREKEEALKASGAATVRTSGTAGILSIVTKERTAPKIPEGGVQLLPHQLARLQEIEDAGEVNRYTDICIKINTLQYTDEGESLEFAMDELKASLRKNASASLLLHDVDIGTMVANMRKRIGEAMTESPTAAKEKKKKPAKELTKQDIAKQLEIPDDF